MAGLYTASLQAGKKGHLCPVCILSHLTLTISCSSADKTTLLSWLTRSRSRSQAALCSLDTMSSSRPSRARRPSVKQLEELETSELLDGPVKVEHTQSAIGAVAQW